MLLFSSLLGLLGFLLSGARLRESGLNSLGLHQSPGSLSGGWLVPVLMVFCTYLEFQESGPGAGYMTFSVHWCDGDLCHVQHERGGLTA